MMLPPELCGLAEAAHSDAARIRVTGTLRSMSRGGPSGGLEGGAARGLGGLLAADGGGELVDGG